jgi:hypothetical protein
LFFAYRFCNQAGAEMAIAGTTATCIAKHAAPALLQTRLLENVFSNLIASFQNDQ